MIIILFGVTASGKTTVGQILASVVGWNFYDADNFHSAANIEKMSHGIPLTDEDRRPWLQSLRALIGHCIKDKKDAVLACSALKEAYRRYLKLGDEVKLVYLKTEFAVVQERLRNRRGHFIDVGLLQSQFDILEPPSADALVIEVNDDPARLAEQIRKELQIRYLREEIVTRITPCPFLCHASTRSLMPPLRSDGTVAAAKTAHLQFVCLEFETALLRDCIRLLCKTASKGHI